MWAPPNLLARLLKKGQFCLQEQQLLSAMQTSVIYSARSKTTEIKTSNQLICFIEKDCRVIGHTGGGGEERWRDEVVVVVGGAPELHAAETGRAARLKLMKL